MNRFFVDPDAIHGNIVSVPEDISAQIRKVLRLKEGTPVRFLDNQGHVYDSRICYLNEKQVYGEITDTHLTDDDSACQITLYIGLTQREKFEWILQKCTEAGVSRIVPVITERSLIRKKADNSAKQDRWEKILKEASEQCGRGRIPVLLPAISFKDAVEQGQTADVSLFCWEEEKQKNLREILEPVRDTISTVSVMVGPEGGFSGEEALAAREHGWQTVTLGRRIYRMETAAMAAVILTLYELER